MPYGEAAVMHGIGAEALVRVNVVVLGTGIGDR